MVCTTGLIPVKQNNVNPARMQELGCILNAPNVQKRVPWAQYVSQGCSEGPVRIDKKNSLARCVLLFHCQQPFLHLAATYQKVPSNKLSVVIAG